MPVEMEDFPAPSISNCRSICVSFVARLIRAFRPDMRESLNVGEGKGKGNAPKGNLWKLWKLRGFLSEMDWKSERKRPQMDSNGHEEGKGSFEFPVSSFKREPQKWELIRDCGFKRRRTKKSGTCVGNVNFIPGTR